MPDLAIFPRDYQVDAIDAVAAAYQRGLRRMVVCLPTGTGKTIVFAILIARKGGRTLVLAHRDELISQAFEKIRMVSPSAKVGIVAAERNDFDQPVICGSVQTLCRPERLRQLPPVDTIVIDECHHAVADSYVEILKGLKGFEPDGPLVLGVTATPDRLDGLGLATVFQEVVYSKNIADFLPHVRPDGLCDLVTMLVSVKDLNLDQVKRAGGDFRESSLAEAMRSSGAIPTIVEHWKRHASDRKTVCFLPSVGLSMNLQGEFQSQGYRAVHVDGSLEKDERRRRLEGFAAGQYQILCNCQIATEGYDEPSIDCVLIGRATSSRALYTQMVGRGLRPFPGKKNCLVLDVVGVSTRHQIVGVADIFGLTRSELGKDSVSSALLRKAATQKSAGASSASLSNLLDDQLELFAGNSRPVDAFGQLAWVRSNGAFVLSLGSTTFTCEQTYTNTWRVIRKEQRRPAELLAENLTQSYAIGIAESHARQLAKETQSEALIAPKAKWRALPATPKQTELMRKLRLPVSEKLTRGQAAAIITAHFAR